MPNRMIVGQKCVDSTSTTVCPREMYENPRSPCTVEATYRTNWSGKIGLSRPQRSRVAASISGVTFGLRPRIRSGEPGIARNMTKLMTTIIAIVKIATAMRRSRKFDAIRRPVAPRSPGYRPFARLLLFGRGPPSPDQQDGRDGQHDQQDPGPEEDR